MDFYLSSIRLINYDTTNSALFFCCYLFIILNCANFGIQDEATLLPSTYNRKHKNKVEEHLLKPEEKYKKFEIQYSFKNAWEIINSNQFVGVPVVKKIRAMWEITKRPKVKQKKPRKKRKNVTTTIKPEESMKDSEDFVITTTECSQTTTMRPRLPGRQNPFVLVEGTLTNTRRKLLRGIMKHTTFAYVRNFRKYPFKYRDKFGSFDLLRLKRAFVTLQFYITGRDIERILENRPVIMSGFWMRQAAEFIARKHNELSLLPSVGSDCYKWPADLIRPDLVFFLHTARPNTTTLETTKRLERIVEVYHRMDPPVIVLDSETYSNVTDKKGAQLRRMIIDKLAPKYPHVYELMKHKKPTKKHFDKGHERNKTSQKRKKIKTTKNITTQVDPPKKDR